MVEAEEEVEEEKEGGRSGGWMMLGVRSVRVVVRVEGI